MQNLTPESNHAHKEPVVCKFQSRWYGGISRWQNTLSMNGGAMENVGGEYDMTAGKEIALRHHLSTTLLL